jgi:hydrogenase-4 component F
VILIVLPLIPLTAALLSRLPLGARFAQGLTLAGSIAAFVLAISLAFDVATAREIVAVAGWISADGLSLLILLLVTFVVMTAALFSWGYLAAHDLDASRVRSYCMHFNLFAFALMLVPLMAEPALTWIAVEFTAVFSVLLVAFENTREALEAAWKYIALMFMGAAVALLGFFLLFWAQRSIGGGHDSWDGLRAVAPHLPPALVTAAFLLILVGFGTKVGFVPMHTWLPDAHSQAPSPACALLSGVKTTVVLYALLRLVPLLPNAHAAMWMQIVGLVSVGVAALLLLQVQDYKRLFAYSTVEHMGIIFVAMGLGIRHGGYAALLQAVSHSVTKSFCFLAAGAVLIATGTREIAKVRGLVRTSPAIGVALLFGALAIGGAPPFVVFLSEFSIFRSGLVGGHYCVTALLVIFITVAFFGILLHVGRMAFGKPEAVGLSAQHAHAPGRLPRTCALALVVGAVPILVLGLYQPAWLHSLVSLAASNLAPAVHP